MAETFPVPARGIGKPDYSKEIALGQTRPGLMLKYGQSLRRFGVTFSAIPSIFPWIKAPLAPGATSHLVNWETGLDMPYNCAVGYTYEVIWKSSSASEDNVIRAYFSTPDLGIPLQYAGNLGLIVSGFPHYISDVVSPASTAAFDPDALYSHQADFVVENLGGDNMDGSLAIIVLQSSKGTEPPPSDKTVKCKWCGHEWLVPREATFIKCPQCDQMNVYCDFSRYKGA